MSELRAKYTQGILVRLKNENDEAIWREQDSGQKSIKENKKHNRIKCGCVLSHLVSNTTQRATTNNFLSNTLQENKIGHKSNHSEALYYCVKREDSTKEANCGLLTWSKG